ncbi:hypothetical protein I4U23_016231 [Adineta vaga]|nr:hypothetical protein I4U23_016231 [Adineta vaga]
MAESTIRTTTTTTTLAELITVTLSSTTTTMTTVSTISSTFVSTTSLTTVITTTATITTTSSTIISTTTLTTVADLNKDNMSDVFISYAGEYSIEIILHGDHGTILSRTKHNNNARALSIAVGDMDSDNKLDIVTANVNQDGYAVGISFNTGYVAFSIARLHYCNWDVLRAIALTDFNGDNNLDIVVLEGNTNGRIYLLRNTGGDYLTCYTSYQVGSEPSSIAIGNIIDFGYIPLANVVTNIIDINNDKKPDIIFANEHSDYVGIILHC